MNELDGLKAEIRDRWGKLPAAALCERIIDHVAGLPPGSAEGLTFGDLCRAAGREAPDGGAPAVVDDMTTALAILVGSGANALDVRMARLDAGGGWHDAGPDWAEEAGGTSAGRLLPVFAPSERLRAALARTAARRADGARGHMAMFTATAHGVALVLNAPDVFEREDFRAWLNEPSWAGTTWHKPGDEPGEHSDVFVFVDGGYEGDGSDMPGDIWRAICDAVYGAFCGGEARLPPGTDTPAVVRLTNFAE